MLGEFYFRFRGAYHVTLSRGLYTRQGTTHNGHQRATWYCLQSTTQQRATDHSTRGAQGLSRGRRRERPPTMAVLYCATPTVLPGRYRRELRPARRPLCRRLRRSNSSRNRKELRLAGSPLHRRLRRSFRAARCYRKTARDDNSIFVCQQSPAMNTATSTMELLRRSNLH